MRRSPVLLIALLLAAGGELRGEARTDADATGLADAIGRFGIDLYRRLDPAGNLFFSPYSVSTALAMTREGAAGRTAAQMDEVMYFPDELAASYRELGGALEPRSVRERTEEGSREVAAYELSMANAIWGQQGLAFLPAFTGVLADVYGAPLERVDFTQADAANRRINAWVAERTRDRIRRILRPEEPGRDTRLVLANAIYFKAPWIAPFDESGTRERSFHRLDGSLVEVPMMHRQGSFSYFGDVRLQVLSLPYLNHDLSMLVVLPRDKAGLPALEAELTHELLASWIGDLAPTRVAVTLPRFEFTNAFELQDVLPDMGMVDAFDPARADFSGMSAEAALYIDLVRHKAYVGVDEAGTEAAAATVVFMRKASAMSPTVEPVPFVADHPFLFLIRHQETGCVLFMGRVSDPAQNGSH